VAALKAAGAGKVFREVASGTKTDRAQLRRLLTALAPGDVLMVPRLDRLARSTRDLLNTLATITGKKARPATGAITLSPVFSASSCSDASVSGSGLSTMPSILTVQVGCHGVVRHTRHQRYLSRRAACREFLRRDEKLLPRLILLAMTKR
jgi:Resolvase, N terminal domain